MGMYLGGEEKKDRERKKSEKKTAVLHQMLRQPNRL
jgi:hypothetical protein